MTNDSQEVVSAVLSRLIQLWTDAALESQAYRRVTEGQTGIREKVLASLSSSPISDRRKSATGMRKQVLQMVSSADHQGAAGVLGELAALLGQIPNQPDPFGGAK